MTEWLILTLASWRLFQLLARDSILERPRTWLVNALGDRFAVMWECSWCLGFYCAVVVLALWRTLQGDPFTVTDAWLLAAVSAGVGLIGEAVGKT